MWTIQEFCTSPQLLVKIQETRRHDGPCTHGECKHSVMGKEAKFIQKLRHQHLGRQPECTPVWLLGDTVEAIRNVDVKDAIKIFTTYKYLCSWLHCKHRWDTIPALCVCLRVSHGS